MGSIFDFYRRGQVINQLGFWFTFIDEQLHYAYSLARLQATYLKAFPDGGFWRSKNFVFDKREAVSVGNIGGDGGVIQKKEGKEKTAK